MKVIKMEIEESKVNKGRFILIVITEDGTKYVASGDHYSPTYLTPYETSFDTKTLQS